MEITNEKKEPFGMYCGEKTEKIVNVTGDHAVIIFRSDGGLERRGFRMNFPASLGKDKCIKDSKTFYCLKQIQVVTRARFMDHVTIISEFTG